MVCHCQYHLTSVSIVALVNIDSIITFFGGDFNDTYEIEVLDEVGVYDEFQATLEANSVSPNRYGNDI